MKRTLILIAVGLAAGLLIVVAAVLGQPYKLRGSQIQPPIPAPDFTLTDGQGGDFRLSDGKGKLALVFFGYTTCPDICPAALGEMKRVSERLGEQSADVRFVFITVDPERDTPERIGTYVSAFDPAFIGLTGTAEALEPVWKAYGVYHEKVRAGSAAGYLVDHSTRTYLVDRGGNLRVTYSFDTTVDDLVQDIRHLLKEK